MMTHPRAMQWMLAPVALFLLGAKPGPPPKEKPVTAPTACLAQVHISRADSPWQGYTSSHEEEQRGKHIECVPPATCQGLERVAHLARYDVDGTPLLVIDRKNRAVVVNAQHLGEINRVDATRLGKGERKILGGARSTWLKSHPRDLVLFLLEAQLIETYWHLEADLCLLNDHDSANPYVAVFSGVHRYCTNSCHADEFRFAVEVDRQDGTITVVGQP